MNGGWDLEFDIMRRCARRSLGAEERVQLRRLLSDGVDWKWLYALGLRHGLLPLIHYHLAREEASAVPAETAARLRARYRAIAFKNLTAVRELVSLIDGLDEQDVFVVPYKGPVLAAQLYGSLSFRESGDLDILVSPADVATTRGFLATRGYRGLAAASEADDRYVLRSRYSEIFSRPGYVVELHWAFTNGDMNVPLGLEELRGELGTVKLGTRDVPCFRSHVLLETLCVHGAKHRWDRLEWVAGVGQVIRDHPDLDWQLVLERARQGGYSRIVLLGVRMAERFVDVDLPPVVRAAIGDDPSIEALAKESARYLLLDRRIAESAEPSGSLAHDLFHYRLRERVRDRLRFIAYRVTTPSRPEEWRTWRFFRWCIPLHAFTRPLRLLRRLIPAVIWRLRATTGAGGQQTES